MLTVLWNGNWYVESPTRRIAIADLASICRTQKQTGCCNRLMCRCQLYTVHPWNASMHSSPTAEMHWMLWEKIDNYFPASSITQNFVFICWYVKGEEKLQGGILGGHSVISKTGICLGHQCSCARPQCMFLNGVQITFPALPSCPPARGTEGITQVLLPRWNAGSLHCCFPTNRNMSSSHDIVLEWHFCSDVEYMS